jgi:glycosyltransferase involved in cell wall biosynthesis
VVTHPVNGGQGSALQTGYLVAERLGVEVVVTLDADGQHVPTEMERLVGPIITDEADFVVGSRRAGSYEREEGADSMARNVGIGIFTRLINVLGGTHVTDVANGYRAIRASRLAEIVFTEDQFHNPELLLGAARAGLRIREVPVTIRVRSAGTSKKGGTFRYGYGFLRVILRSWLR